MLLVWSPSHSPYSPISPPPPPQTLNSHSVIEVGLPRPDRVVFLDLDPEEAQRRGGYGDEKYEKKEMQERVREGFLGLLGKGEEESNDMFLVDAGTSIEEVEGKIWEEVRGVVGSVEGGGWMGLGVVGEWGKDG